MRYRYPVLIRLQCRMRLMTVGDAPTVAEAGAARPPWMISVVDINEPPVDVLILHRRTVDISVVRSLVVSLCLPTKSCRVVVASCQSYVKFEFTFLKGGGVNVFSRVCSFVCLSVCLLARLLKNACMDLDEVLHVDRCRDKDELINF